MGVVLISEITEPVGITVFHIQENINMGNIQEMVQDALAAHNAGRSKIILDFTKIQYISSVGIRGLMEIYRIYNGVKTSNGVDIHLSPTGEEKEKSNFWLSNCSPLILKTLSIAAVSDVIPISATLDEAIQKMTT